MTGKSKRTIYHWVKYLRIKVVSRNPFLISHDDLAAWYTHSYGDVWEIGDMRNPRRLLKQFDRMPIAEIASLAEISPSTIYGWIRRGQLRKRADGSVSMEDVLCLIEEKRMTFALGRPLARHPKPPRRELMGPAEKKLVKPIPSVEAISSDFTALVDSVEDSRPLTEKDKADAIRDAEPIVRWCFEKALEISPENRPKWMPEVLALVKALGA